MENDTTKEKTGFFSKIVKVAKSDTVKQLLPIAQLALSIIRAKAKK